MKKKKKKLEKLMKMKNKKYIQVIMLKQKKILKIQYQLLQMQIMNYVEHFLKIVIQKNW